MIAAMTDKNHTHVYVSHRRHAGLRARLLLLMLLLLMMMMMMLQYDVRAGALLVSSVLRNSERCCMNQARTRCITLHAYHRDGE